ncbi:hypothetical protein FB451DRAFT_1039285, partial [Mycena latifolia]
MSKEARESASPSSLPAPPPEPPVQDTAMTSRPLMPGMERGYALSPMAELRRAWLAESEGEHSLFVRTNVLIGKLDLVPRDLKDRGIDTVSVYPRFSLETGFGMRISQLIAEFQGFIKKVALLNPDRNPDKYFIVDPHSTLMGVLRGAETLEEMTIAWHALRTRFQLGHKYVEKYDSEYKAAMESEILLSPISTAPEIYDDL